MTSTAKEILSDELKFREICIDTFLENDRDKTGFIENAEL